MELHDDHYKREGISEPIEIIEDLMIRHWHKADMPPESAYHVGNALKYLLRAGLKTGQPYHKDLDKAMNYIHRAKTGKWMG